MTFVNLLQLLIYDVIVYYIMYHIRFKLYDKLS